MTESGVWAVWRLAAYLVEMLLWDSSPTEGDTPPWKRLTLLILHVETGSLIASAVETELASYIAQFSELRTEAGHAAVVRNGHHSARPEVVAEFRTGC